MKLKGTLSWVHFSVKNKSTYSRPTLNLLTRTIYVSSLELRQFTVPSGGAKQMIRGAGIDQNAGSRERFRQTLGKIQDRRLA